MCHQRKMPEIVPLEWTGDSLRMLDQTMLPQEEAVVTARTHTDVVQAIGTLQIRGAPAIGVAGAYALVLAAKAVSTLDMQRMFNYLADVGKEVASARPTARNLQWAVARVLNAAYSTRSISDMRRRIEAEAIAIHHEDLAANRSIGRLGAELLSSGDVVLTHCNTGALATAGYGTALGVIRTAWEAGKKIRVLVTETRPVLQGARLTMWELVHLGIPAELIVDSAAGTYLAKGEVSYVLVGADRVSANGDTANKIGTYPLAVVARENGVPFYVVSPTSTLDMSLASGDGIQIEERDLEEVYKFGKVATTPKGIKARNPAFDVTPNRYVSGIVTEKGVVRPPFAEELRKLTEGEVAADDTALQEKEEMVANKVKGEVVG